MHRAECSVAVREEHEKIHTNVQTSGVLSFFVQKQASGHGVRQLCPIGTCACAVYTKGVYVQKVGGLWSHRFNRYADLRASFSSHVGVKRAKPVGHRSVGCRSPHFEYGRWLVVAEEAKQLPPVPWCKTRTAALCVERGVERGESVSELGGWCKR
jgi:hypothetical protein